MTLEYKLKNAKEKIKRLEALIIIMRTCENCSEPCMNNNPMVDDCLDHDRKYWKLGV